MDMRKLTQYLGALLLGGMLSTAWAEPLDINQADAAALAETMVGVGPAKADDIVAYRKEHGPFRQVDDLALIKGIGPSIVAKNRDKLTATPPTPPKE